VPKGFRIVGKVLQELDTFRTPLQIRVLTDGNPEMKTIEVVGRESDFTILTFGRPKQNGLQLDPNNQILKSSPRLRLRAAIARGEDLAADGRFFDAIQEYQQALELQKNNSLASFRMGEAFFYQKNYQAAANAFRDALEGDLEPTLKWIEVWSHIYIGKIFDLSGQRERAVNEYNKAQELNDDTGGALKEIERWLKEPYKENPGD
jgi:tetratricopeptide (TPR) repeat protein